MDLTDLIHHPEHLDKKTLFELRSMLAVYPYFQTVRLLMLQNLYLLHDPTFNEELRRAAVYITDRQVIFQMIEAAHYKLTRPETPQKEEGTDSGQPAKSRTISLIDGFLETIPQTDEKSEAPKKKRRPTPADAAIDYVAYMMDAEEEEEDTPQEESTPQMRGQELIDDFINKDKGKITLSETPQFVPQIEDSNNDGKEADEGYFTETLARIYIKQGRYSKALEIIKRLSLNYPKKNAYFADQIRFLEKLIINNNKK